VRPIYAPALVGFIGGNGWSLSLSIGGGAQRIGWFPIGPREVYMPSYHVSRDYFNRVNVNNTVVNNTTITNVYNNYSSGTINVNQGNYANRNAEHAVTVVPSTVFVNAQPVARAAIRVDRKKLSTGETMRIAPIAPSERSVIGAGKAAKARPAKDVYDRQVVVHNAPPPAELPFAKRKQQLQKNPGQPLSASTTGTAQAKSSKPARNVRVVTNEKDAVDARTATTGRKSNSGKTEKLDRSVKAPKAHEPAKGVAPQAAAQPQHKPNAGPPPAQQPQHKSNTGPPPAQQPQHEPNTGPPPVQQQRAQDKAKTDQQNGKAADHQTPEDDGQADSKQQKSKSKSQAECEREAKKNHRDPGECRVE
jgi:hypothetical protein